MSSAAGADDGCSRLAWGEVEASSIGDGSVVVALSGVGIGDLHVRFETGEPWPHRRFDASGLDGRQAVLLVGRRAPGTALLLGPKDAVEPSGLRRIDDFGPITAGALAARLKPHAVSLGALIDLARLHPTWAAALVACAPSSPLPRGRAAGAVLAARGVDAVGGLVHGWALARPGDTLLLIDGDGSLLPLDEAPRATAEPDPEAVAIFGEHAHRSGFVSERSGDLDLEGVVTLLWSDGRRLAAVASVPWRPAPVTPRGFAEWAASIPTARSDFDDRIARCDGPLLAAIVEHHRPWLSASPHRRLTFGVPPVSPVVSVVIPLDRDRRCVVNQMLEFDEDPDFTGDVEVVWVVDPGDWDAAAAEARRLHAAHDLPFVMVSAPTEGTRAAAIGRGVEATSGALLLLLGASVVPLEVGWVARMRALLDERPSIGVLGGRLLDHDGSIRSEGLALAARSPLEELSPLRLGAGRDPSHADTPLIAVEAVSSAFAMVRRRVWDEVGGIDEDGLDDDVADIDWCRRVAATGREILCLRDIALADLSAVPGVDGPAAFRRRCALWALYRQAAGAATRQDPGARP